MSAAHEITSLSDIDSLANAWARIPDSDEPQAPDAPQQGRAKIESIEQIKPISAYANQEIEWIVPGFIVRGTVNAITGDSGSGKTSLVSKLGYCVATGTAFAGIPTKMTPVLDLDRENPLSITVERDHRLGISDHPNLIRWGGWCEEEAPSPFSPIVISWVQRTEPKPLIIVDSYAAFFDGDENSASDTRTFTQGFRRLADLGATVVLIHHTGKAESARDYRGSSDLKAAIDVGFTVSNLGDSSKLSTLKLRAFKARFSVTAETIFRYADGAFEIDDDGLSMLNQDILRDLLVANPAIKTEEFVKLATAKGVTRSRARTFLRSGVENGEIRSEKHANNSSHYHWNGGRNSGSPSY